MKHVMNLAFFVDNKGAGTCFFAAIGLELKAFRGTYPKDYYHSESFEYLYFASGGKIGTVLHLNNSILCHIDCNKRGVEK